MTKLSIGFSPCPNDTFIFDALIHQKIDTEGIEFEPVIADVEELNQRAFKSEIAITKLSYHAFAWLRNQYVLLNTGSALGNGCGPLLISREPMSEEEINRARIAIPGKYTTANFLLGLAYPKSQNRYAALFSDIEEDVLKGRADAGLIIHENRFTYEAKGLKKLLDLGEYWETNYQLPIPLGGIAARRDLDGELLHRINRVMRRSVAYAFDNPSDSMPFVRTHAQEMSDKVMQQHIGLYVNNFTLDLGERGKAAVLKIFEVAEELGIIPPSELNLFVE